MDGAFIHPLNADGFNYAIVSFDRIYPTGRIELVGDDTPTMMGFLAALKKEAGKLGTLPCERGTRYYIYNRINVDDYKNAEEDGQKLLEFINRVEDTAAKPSDAIGRHVKLGQYDDGR